VTDPAAILPIVLVVAGTMLAGILCNLGIWFVVIRLLKQLASRLGVHLYLAVRQLGGRRSGYVSITALVAMWGISASSCNLITTLSVMGGFGEDLKNKILGTKSHVIIDRPGGEVVDYERVMQSVSALKGVVGVAPYVQGEVMVRSAVNISGAVLRGIDPALAGRVTNLDETMQEGSLSYLEHPERILADRVFGRRWKPSGAEADSGTDAGDRKQERDRPKPLTEVLGEATGTAKGGTPAARASPPPSLPGVIVGREMVKNLSLYLGDEVKLIAPLGELGPTGPMPKSRTYRVAGIFFSGMYEYDAKNAYVTLEAGRSFLGIEEGVSGLEVKVENPDRVEGVAARIEGVVKAIDGDLRVRHWKELNRSLFSALLLEKIGMFIMLSVIVLIAYLIIITTLYMMVMEKTPDIAVLKTLGCSESSIYRIFQIEGLILGLSGTFTGVALGVAQTLGLEHFGVPLDPDVHYISKLPVQMDGTEVAVVALASLAICLLITILPARRASRLSVVDGLRFK
jgi:lipoprotein-releasing system permease protein